MHQPQYHNLWTFVPIALMVDIFTSYIYYHTVLDVARGNYWFEVAAWAWLLVSITISNFVVGINVVFSQTTECTCLCCIRKHSHPEKVAH